MDEHTWKTAPRDPLPGGNRESDTDTWKATPAGLWLNGELIDFPAVAREILRLREGWIETRLHFRIDRLMAIEPGEALALSGSPLIYIDKLTEDRADVVFTVDDEPEGKV